MYIKNRWFRTTVEELEALAIPEPNTGCLFFIAGYENAKGYVFYNDWPVHRLIYTLRSGVLINPEDDIHHTCEIKCCIAEGHLIKLNHTIHAKLHNTIQTLCKNGHLLECTAFINSNGKRECLVCKRARERNYYHRRKSPCGSTSHLE